MTPIRYRWDLGWSRRASRTGSISATRAGRARRASSRRGRGHRPRTAPRLRCSPTCVAAARKPASVMSETSLRSTPGSKPMTQLRPPARMKMSAPPWPRRCHFRHCLPAGLCRRRHTANRSPCRRRGSRGHPRHRGGRFRPRPRGGRLPCVQAQELVIIRQSCPTRDEPEGRV